MLWIYLRIKCGISIEEERMKKKIKFIEKNYEWILLIIFLGIMLYIHNFIYLGGDDYIYGSYTKGTINEFFQSHINHYRFKNGRAIVHFIVTLFLKFDVYIWRIVNPLIIASLVILISKVTYVDKDKYKKSVVLSIILISFISINISREAIFWLDGSVNYLYPMLLFLLNVYLVKKTIYEDKKLWYLPIIGFISGATVEQAGLMTIGMVFLKIIEEVFIKKKSINKIIYVSFISTIIGYLTVILAPGNLIRSSKQSPEIIGNMVQLFRYNFMSDKMYLFILLLMMSSILWLRSFIKSGYNKKINKLLTNIMIINIVIYSMITSFTTIVTKLASRFSSNIQIFDSLWQATSLLDRNNIFGGILWAIAAISVCITIATLVYEGIIIVIKDKSMTLLSFVIVAVGAQFMMIISPIFGYRTVFPTLIVWIIVIIMSIINNLGNKYILPMILICAMLTLDNSYIKIIGILAIFIIIILKRKIHLKYINTVCIVILTALSIVNFGRLILGFKENSPIHEYNISKIEEYKENNFQGELNLKKAKNFEYRYTMIYESEPHVSSFKKYYGLPEDTIINFN